MSKETKHNADKRADREAANGHGTTDIDELLPWYVTGKLAEAERCMVEQHLAEHPEAARQIALIREEREAMVAAANEAVPGSQVGALERLLREVSCEEEREAGGLGKQLGAWWREFGESFAHWVTGLAPGTRSFAVSAALVLLLVQALAIGVLVGNRGGSPDRYVTATDQSPGDTAKQKTYLLVQFTPEARLGAITALFEPLGAVIVEGPKSDGFYQVRISERVMDKAEIARVIARLQAHGDLIQFAGRTD